MAIINDTGISIIKTYVAAFMRAPDKGGYEYWLNSVTSNGLSATLGTIFSLDIVKAIYPAAMSSAQFVTAIYGNVFNKTPDTDGLNYWKSFIDQGTLNRGELVLLMINAGLGTPEGTAGRDVILNKAIYAYAATEMQLINSVDVYITQGVASMQSVMAGVTGDRTTIDHAFAATVQQGPASIHQMDTTLSRYFGGAAAEKIDGSAGNDTIDAGGGNDYVLGGAGNDSLYSGLGSDLIDGGAGDDWLFGGSPESPDGIVSEDDTLLGGVGNDTLIGQDTGDYLLGGGNDDLLYGRSGNDTMDGGVGNDNLYGEQGNDSMSGNVGNDFLAGGDGSDVLLGGDGDDKIYTDEFVFDSWGAVYIDSNDYANGGSGNDTITANYGADTLIGGSGDDWIDGRFSRGTATINADGGAGNDLLWGGSNSDTLLGGEGLDTLEGGGGNDLIILTEVTQVKDEIGYSDKSDFGETGDMVVGFTAADLVQFDYKYELIDILGASTFS